MMLSASLLSWACHWPRLTGYPAGGVEQQKRGCFAALFGQGAARQPEDDTLPTQHDEDTPWDVPRLVFRLRQDFLSPTEMSFFKAAEIATRGRYSVMTKVNLADLLTSPTRDIRVWNKINQKHLDFLLLDIETMRPALAIELDDSSHKRDKAARADRLKDEAFASAGLPLLRFTARRAYTTNEINSAIESAVAPAVATPPEVVPPAKASAAQSTGTPICPRCGVSMVLRPKVEGRYEAFYGCVNYPRCREVKAATTP